MAVARVNGTSLYYAARGQRGRALLFIHGDGGSAESWAGQARRLNRRVRCVTYDRRGHSRSASAGTEEITAELDAEDAAGLIHALELAPCVIIAASGGGRPAMEVVRRHADLVAGVVLVEPAFGELDPAGWDAFRGAVRPVMASALATGGQDAAVEAFIEALAPGLWATLSEAQRARYRENGQRLLGATSGRHTPIHRADLARIQRPCLVLRGERSFAVFRTVAEIVAESVPGCQLTDLRDAGHLAYLEQPDAFAQAVMSFVERIG